MTHHNKTLVYFWALIKPVFPSNFKMHPIERNFNWKTSEWNHYIPTQSSCLFSAWHLRQASKSKQEKDSIWCSGFHLKNTFDRRKLKL